MPSPLELAARGRRDAEDARRLKQWKRDPEVYAQIERSIAVRHEREQEIDRRESRKAERKAEILEAERIERDSLTPLSRMHSANFIAFSCVPAVLLLLPVRGRCVRTTRDDHGEHGKGGQRPEYSPHGLSPRVVIALTPALCRACWSLLHPWIVRRVGVYGRP